MLFKQIGKFLNLVVDGLLDDLAIDGHQLEERERHHGDMKVTGGNASHEYRPGGFLHVVGRWEYDGCQRIRPHDLLHSLFNQMVGNHQHGFLCQTAGNAFHDPGQEREGFPPTHVITEQRVL